TARLKSKPQRREKNCLFHGFTTFSKKGERAARRREQSPAISVFVSWAPPLQAKPITEAIQNNRIIPSPSLEYFQANVVVLIQLNRDAAAPANPYFHPLPILPNQIARFWLFQLWIFQYARRPAQFVCQAPIFSIGFLPARARSAQDFRHFV